MITIECIVCGREARVKGYVVDTNCWDEPGETVIDDSEDFSECCCCVRDGGDYIVTAYDPPTFDDDVI